MASVGRAFPALRNPTLGGLHPSVVNAIPTVELPVWHFPTVGQIGTVSSPVDVAPVPLSPDTSLLPRVESPAQSPEQLMAEMKAEILADLKIEMQVH